MWFVVELIHSHTQSVKSLEKKKEFELHASKNWKSLIYFILWHVKDYKTKSENIGKILDRIWVIHFCINIKY